MAPNTWLGATRGLATRQSSPRANLVEGPRIVPAAAGSASTPAIKRSNARRRSFGIRRSHTDRFGFYRSGEIEQQHLGVIGLLEHDLPDIGDFERVARFERLAVHGYAAARH